MKETLGKILRIFTTVLMVLSICMMIFTVISVLTFNRSDRQLFGYRAFIVLSDSMSATDFKAGDLVLTRDVDPATLQPGDIIVDVDDTVITTFSQMSSIISSKSAGDVIKVKVYRVEGLDDLLNDENITLDDIPEGQYVDMEITLAVVDNVKQ